MTRFQQVRLRKLAADFSLKVKEIFKDRRIRRRLEYLIRAVVTIVAVGVEEEAIEVDLEEAVVIGVVDIAIYMLLSHPINPSINTPSGQETSIMIKNRGIRKLTTINI